MPALQLMELDWEDVKETRDFEWRAKLEAEARIDVVFRALNYSPCEVGTRGQNSCLLGRSRYTRSMLGTCGAVSEL